MSATMTEHTVTCPSCGAELHAITADPPFTPRQVATLRRLLLASHRPRCARKAVR